jgi:type I restriction enzyme S subunit
MEKYQSYKPSGVEWIGEIPSNWVVTKIKYVSEVITGNTPSKTDEDNYSDGKYLWIKPDGLNGFYPTNDCKEKISEKGLSETRIVPPLSVLINGIGNIGKFGYSELSVSTNQQLHSIVFNTNKVDKKYGLYLISSLTDEMNKNSEKVVISIYTKSKLERLEVILPSLHEQHQIVQFLDEKTELIDKLISTKELKITLLKEQRTSLINEVVTKGLNPNVKMKDSGVEWIGEIPQHWEITKLKYLVTFDSGYSFNSSDYVDEGVNLIRIGSLYDNTLDLERSPVFLPIHFLNQHQNFVVKKNDILISLTGTLGKRDYGYSIVYDKDFPSLLNQRVGRLKLKSEDLNFKLFTSILHSEYYLNQLFCKPTGTKQGNFSSDDIVSNYIFLPPNQEQLQIVEHLDSKTKEIDDLVQLEQKKIDLLKEYRQSLISEVVTGKIKVTQ